MASCKKCGQSNLEWVQENGKYRLYNGVTGTMHDSCKMTASEYKALQKPTIACKHGILKDRACDMCEAEL